jgi:hypothetical protein
MLIAITVATQQACALLVPYLATYAVMNPVWRRWAGQARRQDGATLDDFRQGRRRLCSRGR